MNTANARSLESRVVIITGAANGIGRAMARAFALEGATVVAVDVDGDGAAAVATELVASGATALSMRTDVSDPTEVTAAIDRVLAELGRIDILCNNAGILDSLLTVTEVPLDRWERVMAVNVTGPFLLSQAVLPHMLERGSGVILNTSSVAGLQGGRAGAAYTASKHAIIGLTRSTAWTYAEQGIRCNAICPGGVETDISAHGPPATGSAVERYRMSNTVRPRKGKPEEIATVATFLASDAAGFINGQAIVADAGWLAM